MSNLNPQQFEKIEIPAEDAQIGDRTASNLKTRISQVHTTNKGNVLHATKTSGRRSGSVNTYRQGEKITVWRRKAK